MSMDKCVIKKVSEGHQKPRVSIIIVSYNTRELLRDCLKSIYKHVRGVTWEAVVVDNGSTDGSVEMVQTEYPSVRLIVNNQNLGFGVANNIGAKKSSGTYLMFLNSDTVLVEDTVNTLQKYMEKEPGVGIVGPAVFLADGQLQPKTCGNYPVLRIIFNDALLLSRLVPVKRYFPGMHLEDDDLTGDTMEVDWVSGVCMLIRKDLFQEVGGFDPDYFMYTEDIDLCWRIKRAGWKVVRVNITSIIHYCGASSKTDADKIRNSIMQQRNLLKMISKSSENMELFLAKTFIVIGLTLRLTVALLRSIYGHKSSNFLLISSIARLKDLLGIR